MTGLGMTPVPRLWHQVSADGMADMDRRATEHGEWLKEKRLDLGLNRPAFVSEMSKHGQDITPDYLNKLERGTAALSRASLDVREAIRLVLGYTADDWHNATGLYAPTDTLPVANTKPLPTPAPEVQLPQGLQDAITLYGKRFSDLNDPVWQQYLAGFRWRDGEPEDPEAWLDLYRDLTRAGVVPGSN